MQRWSEHVRDVTGEYPQAVPGKLIDLTKIEPVADVRDPDDLFGAGESLDVDIPQHLLQGGIRSERYFDWS